VQGRHRHHEVHPVGGGNQAAVPGSGDFDLGLSVDQQAGDIPDALSPEVTLVGADKAAEAERLDARSGDLSERDVARFGQQHRGEADVEVLGAWELP
jgi:hypothetical protein